MHRALAHLRGHAVGYLALFVALGGVGYAATLPRNSVGTAQLKANAVTAAKVKDGSLTAKDFRSGQLPAGKTGATGPQGAKGDTGPQGPKGDTGPATGAASGDLTGTYPAPTIGDGKVTAAKLGAGAVETAKLADGAVTAAKLARAAHVQFNGLTSNVAAGGFATLNTALQSGNAASRITVNAQSLAPAEAGLYLVGGSVQWENDATGSYRQITVERTGPSGALTMVNTVANGALAGKTQPFSAVVPLAVGDAVRVTVSHDAGTALDVNLSGSIAQLGG